MFDWIVGVGQAISLVIGLATAQPNSAPPQPATAQQEQPAQATADTPAGALSFQPAAGHK